MALDSFQNKSKGETEKSNVPPTAPDRKTAAEKPTVPFFTEEEIHRQENLEQEHILLLAQQINGREPCREAQQNLPAIRLPGVPGEKSDGPITERVLEAKNFRQKIETMLQQNFPSAVSLLADSCGHANTSIALFSKNALKSIMEARGKDNIYPVLKQKMQNASAPVGIGVAICEFDPSDVIAREFLFEKLRIEGEEGQDAAITLADIGDSVTPRLLQALNDPSVTVRKSAVLVIFHQENLSESVIPTLIKLVQDPDPSLRSLAVGTIVRILSRKGLTDAQVIPALRTALKDPIQDIRIQAAMILASKKEKDAFPVLKEHVFDASPAIPKVMVLAALMSADENQGISVLLQLLGNQILSSYAGKILLGLPSMHDDHIKECTKLLNAGDEHIRWWAARIIAHHSTPNEQAIRCLIESLADTDHFDLPLEQIPCFSESANGLERHAAISLPHILQALHDENQPEILRGRIANVLPLNANTEKVLTELHASLNDKSLHIRVGAAANLASAGNDLERVIPILLDGLKSDDIYLRSVAVVTLHVLPHVPPEALPAVQSFLVSKDKDPTFGPLARMAADNLVSRLSDTKEKQ